MPLNVKVSGVYKDVSSVYARVGGAWKQVAEVYVKINGAWKSVWTYLFAGLDYPSYSGSAEIIDPGFPAFAAVICTCAAPPGSTYNWIVTGPYSTLTGIGTNTLTIVLSSTTPTSANGTVRCEVTLGADTISTDTSLWDCTIT